MTSARESIKAYSGDISDILTAALYRIDGTRFVRAKYSAGGLPHPELIHILDE